jgi:hypothetical protein
LSSRTGQKPGWTVNIAHEPPRDDLFLGRKYDFERDDRVSLYGKPAHR